MAETYLVEGISEGIDDLGSQIVDHRLDGLGVRAGQRTGRLDVGGGFGDRGLQGHVGSQEVLGLVVGDRAGEGVDGVVEGGKLGLEQVKVPLDV